MVVRGGRYRDQPGLHASRARAGWTTRSDDPTYLAGAEPVLDGMRKAGVP